MESKSTDWRPGNTVCRCCLTEGCYKDISTEYFWMGKREVYSEMLTETFDLNIAFSKSGGPNSNSRLICEPCISRLRDASDFKRQVQECERTFMQFLDPGSSGVMTEVELDKEVKIEAVKLEEASDEDLFDDRDFGTMDDDDDDDLDDQPLTKLASKIPKKESVDIMELLDSAKVGDKRKASTKLKVSPTKKVSSRIIKITGKEVKVKNKKLLVKATTSSKEPKATVSKLTVKPEKKKKEKKTMCIARQNAQTVMKYATAYPFRLPECQVVCCYCYEGFDDPAMFRNHNEQAHDVNVKIAFSHIHEGYIKVDCTDLKCRLCSLPFEHLDQIATHLKYNHDKDIDLTHEIGMQPFKMEKDKLLCAICSTKFTTFRSLSRHTQKHFAKFTCETCGKSYATVTSLSQHVTFHHKTDKRLCIRCKKTFATMNDFNEHLLLSKNCYRYICTICAERFLSYRRKMDHMMAVHEQAKKVHNCLECGTVFETHEAFRMHFKLEHTNDYFECSSCEKKFETQYKLRRHLIVHTNEKLFTCEVCSKSFSRDYTLKQHMWIHSKVKKWECTMCDKQFNQRVSWKTHMKSHHPQLCDW